MTIVSSHKEVDLTVNKEINMANYNNCSPLAGEQLSAPASGLSLGIIVLFLSYLQRFYHPVENRFLPATLPGRRLRNRTGNATKARQIVIRLTR